MYNHDILIGDCRGVDALVQEYTKHYEKVTVFFVGNSPRNFKNSQWKIKHVTNPLKKTGRDFYSLKDNSMSIDCDIAVMIWNGASIGTFNNIKNCETLNKDILVFKRGTKIIKTTNNDLQNVFLKLFPDLN